MTLEHKMYVKILSCLVAFQNRPSAPIGRVETFVDFEFLEGQFCKQKPSFLHLKKTRHSFDLSLPICVL